MKRVRNNSQRPHESSNCKHSAGSKVLQMLQRVQPSSAPTRYTETVQMFCTSANFHAAMAHPRGYTYRQSNETKVVTEWTVTSDHCHFSMEVFQVLHTLTAAKLFLLLPMKYRTRSPICTVTSGRLDTTLSLQNPSNPIMQNVTLICLQEWQPSPRVRASNTGSRHGKKEKKNPQPTWRGYRCWKFKWRLLLLISLLQEKKKFSIKPIIFR